VSELESAIAAKEAEVKRLRAHLSTPDKIWVELLSSELLLRAATAEARVAELERQRDEAVKTIRLIADSLPGPVPATLFTGYFEYSAGGDE